MAIGQCRETPVVENQELALEGCCHASGTLSGSDIELMEGTFDTGGSSSFQLKAQCDLQRRTFNESVIQFALR